MATLPPEAPYLDDRHSYETQVAQRISDLVQPKRLNDRFDFLHGLGGEAGAASPSKRSKGQVKLSMNMTEKLAIVRPRPSIVIRNGR